MPRYIDADEFICGTKETELKPFECDNGRVYNFPKEHCAFCKNCTNVYYDYSNGPYLFLCDIGEGDFKTCGKFEGEDEEVDDEQKAD